MNRKQRRRKGGTGPMGPQEFEQELIKVIHGDPSADPTVREFWDQYTAATGIQVAVAGDDDIEVLRAKKGRKS